MRGGIAVRNARVGTHCEVFTANIEFVCAIVCEGVSLGECVLTHQEIVRQDLFQDLLR